MGLSGTKWGRDQDKTLVPIEDVPRGTTQLKCPYCGGELTAKKGHRKEHCFAHTLETCREVARKSDRAALLLKIGRK